MPSAPAMPTVGRVFQRQSQLYLKSVTECTSSSTETHLCFFKCSTCSAIFICFANNFETLGFFTPCLGRPVFRALNVSAALIPDAVTTMVCGAPVGVPGVGFKSVLCCFKNPAIFSSVRGSVQVVLSLMHRADDMLEN